MSANLGLHGVSAIKEVDTDPICGRPRLSFTLIDEDGGRSGITLFMSSQSAGLEIGSALVLAGSALVKACAPDPEAVT